ncbi:hypothetical protein [Alloyangia pacifica]|uniref:hypothetical protein n=1 Tax=Alloyangia pacifica TaxID=311180 RepID=UPI0031DE102B
MVGFTQERAAIIYDEREFDEEDLPTSPRDLASFIGENDSVHFLQDYNLVMSRAVWVQKTAREPEKPLPTHPAILHPPSSARRQRLERARGVARRCSKCRVAPCPICERPDRIGRTIIEHTCRKCRI